MANHIPYMINGKRVHTTPTGVKLGSRGKVLPLPLVFGSLPKGEARKLRKALRKAGHTHYARDIRVTPHEDFVLA